jgi:hypothetical protein
VLPPVPFWSSASGALLSELLQPLKAVAEHAANVKHNNQAN